MRLRPAVQPTGVGDDLQHVAFVVDVDGVVHHVHLADGGELPLRKVVGEHGAGLQVASLRRVHARPAGRSYSRGQSRVVGGKKKEAIGWAGYFFENK